MSIFNDLQTHDESKHELCGATGGVDVFKVPASSIAAPPFPDTSATYCVLAYDTVILIKDGA